MVRFTKVQTDVNVPFVRFKDYMDDLEKKGLIITHPQIALTAEGEKYIQEYRRVREFLEKFGLVRTEKSAGS